MTSGEASKEYVEVLPGVKSRLVYCDDHIIVLETVIEPGARVPEHKHDSMQITIVLEGTLELSLASNLLRLEPGDYTVIPPNVEHGAASPGGARVLDINSPLTSDRLKLIEKLGGCPGSA